MTYRYFNKQLYCKQLVGYY